MLSPKPNIVSKRVRDDHYVPVQSLFQDEIKLESSQLIADRT